MYYIVIPMYYVVYRESGEEKMELKRKTLLSVIRGAAFALPAIVAVSLVLLSAPAFAVDKDHSAMDSLRNFFSVYPSPAAKPGANVSEKIRAAVPVVPAPTAVVAPDSLTAGKENDLSIHVGDEVLVVFNGGTGFVGKVKKLFADNTAIVDFGSGYERKVVPLDKNVSKSVKSRGGLSVGDHVIDAYNWPAKVEKLFTNGQALVSYGAGFSKMFRDIASLSKQIE